MIDLAPVESTVKPLLWPCRIGGMFTTTVEFEVVMVDGAVEVTGPNLRWISSGARRRLITFSMLRRMLKVNNISNSEWRLYRAWVRSEVTARAPLLIVLMAQALAGRFAKAGFLLAAVLILVPHHAMLRTCELYELRTGDVHMSQRSCLLVLRETKMCQRNCVHQGTTIDDSWLIERVRQVLAATAPGQTLVQMSPHKFLTLRKQACLATGMPSRYTPYGLRRGGAMTMFQCCCILLPSDGQRSVGTSRCL